MGRRIDWDSVPDQTLLPEDLYTLEVDDLTEETSKAGALMYRGVFRVADGGVSAQASYVGTPLYDYFVIGNGNDPTGQEPETLKNSVGLRRLKRLFKAAQIPFAADVDEMVEVVKGQRFVAAVGQEVDDGVKDPKYKGVKRNRINAMYPVGTMVPGAASTMARGETSVSPSKPSPAPARAGAKATAAPTVPCPFCNTAVPRATYSQHVRDTHPDEA